MKLLKTISWRVKLPVDDKNRSLLVLTAVTVDRVFNDSIAYNKVR